MEISIQKTKAESLLTPLWGNIQFSGFRFSKKDWSD
jgi:hypothetical protein